MSENELFENCKEEILNNILHITRNSYCEEVDKSTSVNNLASAYLKLVQAEKMKGEQNEKRTPSGNRES